MDKFMPSAMYSIYLILLSLVVLSLLVLVINLKKKKTSPQTYPYEPFPLRTRVFRNASQKKNINEGNIHELVIARCMVFIE